MKDLRIFKSEAFGEIRTLEIENKPHLALIDVCKILDIKNSRDAKTRLNQDGVVTTDIIDNLGRKQQTTFIDESNLYKLIFQSRKQEAERFTEWVTSEVLPKIRKTGMYATEELLDNPDFAIQALQRLKSEREKRKQLETTVEEQKPKVLFADSVQESESCISVNEMAKLLKQNGVDIGEERLFIWLRDSGYLSKTKEDWNIPTQKAMELQLFRIKKSTYKADGKTFVSRTPKVTGKGQIYFVNKFKELINKT